MRKNKQITTDSFASAATELNAMHKDLMAIAEDVLSRAIAIGKKLDAIKTKLAHGAWENWVNDNLTFTSRTARRYIEAYRSRHDPELKTDPEKFMSRIYGNEAATEFARPVKVRITKFTKQVHGICYTRDLEPNRTSTSEMPLESDDQSDPEQVQSKVAKAGIDPKLAIVSDLPEPSKATDEDISQTAQDTSQQLPASYLDKLKLQHIASSQWVLAASTAEQAISELERLQGKYGVHLDHMTANYGDQKEATDLIQKLSKVTGFDFGFDFEQVKKTLIAAERLPIPDEADYDIRVD
jgi:hypothetical protein